MVHLQVAIKFLFISYQVIVEIRKLLKESDSDKAIDVRSEIDKALDVLQKASTKEEQKMAVLELARAWKK